MGVGAPKQFCFSLIKARGKTFSIICRRFLYSKRSNCIFKERENNEIQYSAPI